VSINLRHVLCASAVFVFVAGCASAGPAKVTGAPRTARLSEPQLLAIASVLERRGDAMRAGQYLSLALAQGADSAQVVPRLLRLYVRDGQYRLALDLAENHLRRRPRDLRTRFVLGTLCTALGMSARAAEQYERVLAGAVQRDRHERLRADAHFALASLLHEQGQDVARADAHYRAYLRLRPAGQHAETARAALLTELP
jgi:tetratricopeptide (TPR) repeat protein